MSSIHITEMLSTWLWLFPLVFGFLFVIASNTEGGGKQSEHFLYLLIGHLLLVFGCKKKYFLALESGYNIGKQVLVHPVKYLFLRLISLEEKEQWEFFRKWGEYVKWTPDQQHVKVWSGVNCLSVFLTGCHYLNCIKMSHFKKCGSKWIRECVGTVYPASGWLERIMTDHECWWGSDKCRYWSLF